MKISPIAKCNPRIKQKKKSCHTFSEYAPPDQNMFYGLTIYREGNNFFGEINIDGFQTMERLLATVSGDENGIELKFFRYLPDNIFEPYEEGDILLTLRQKRSETDHDLWRDRTAFIGKPESR
ncbi:MAG TPA: DUF5991 domain-containing protein [Capillibacterium sp.]